MGLMALAAVKKGISVGKDLSSLSKDLGKIWDAIDKVNVKHKTASKGKGGASSRALDSYIETVQARDLEDQLRRLIMETRGNSGWIELQNIRQKVLKEDREGRAEAIRIKNQRVYWASVVFGVLVVIFSILGLIWVAIYLREASN